MRSSLIGSLMQVLKFNADRKAERVRVFELGRIFLKDAAVVDSDTTVKGFHQPMRVAGLAWGAAEQLQWSRGEAKVDFYDVKGDVEALLAPRKPVFEPAEHPAMHPGRCARVFELELDAVLAREVPVFKPVAKQQAVERDIAVVVNEKATHAQLMQAVEAAQTGGLLRSAVLFDVFRPKALKAGETAAPGALAQDEKSLAVRLTLGQDDSSLTDVQIEQAVQAVIEQLQQRLGARLRA
jgi:phenylalanyl-tRNA synthetase beta chain